MSEIEWPEGFKDNKCPDCGCVKFLRGPEGACSVNIKCAGCGSTFNEMGALGIERLTVGRTAEVAALAAYTDEERSIFLAVLQELGSARAKFKPFNSSHEGYAAILEEVDELWDEVKDNKRADTLERQRHEAIQVGAMGIRYLLDVCNDAALAAERERGTREK